MKPLFLFFFFYAFSIFFFFFLFPLDRQNGCTKKDYADAPSINFIEVLFETFHTCPGCILIFEEGEGERLFYAKIKNRKKRSTLPFQVQSRNFNTDHELKKIYNNKICYVFLEDVKSINCWTLRSSEIRTIRKVQWVKLIRNM